MNHFLVSSAISVMNYHTMLISNQMKVEVFNESASGNKVHVGMGQVILKNAIPKMDQPQTVLIDLTYRSKKKEEQKGKVIFNGILHSGKIPIATVGPPKNVVATTTGSQNESPSAYLLSVKDFYAKDLANTGNILDAQDPSLTVIIGKSKFNTQRCFYQNFSIVSRH